MVCMGSGQQFTLPRHHRSAHSTITARPPAWQGLLPESGHLLDLRMKAGIAQRLALIERKTDIVYRFAVKLGAEQHAVRRLSNTRYEACST